MNPQELSDFRPAILRSFLLALVCSAITTLVSFGAGLALRRRFIVAGGAEAPEGTGSYEQYTIRPRDRSPDGIREKAQWVLTEAERRMASLGFGWSDCTATQLYTAYNVHHILEDEIWRRGAANAGLTWQYCRPPVDVLDYEMDMRGISIEHVLP